MNVVPQTTAQIPPPTVPRKSVQFAQKKKKSLIIRVTALFLLPLLGAIVGLSLIQLNQDVRQQASEGVYTTLASASTPTPTPIVAPTPSDTCTPQEYLNCANGCDSATGRCRVSSSPSPTPIPKANNERCSSDSECLSHNCLAAPSGKYCVPAGQSLGKIAEGQPCATNAYDRECQAGLVCENNRCIKAAEVQTTPEGSCLQSGESCAGGRGYSDSSCSGTNIRCGTRPSPTPTPTLTPKPSENAGLSSSQVKCNPKQQESCEEMLQQGATQTCEAQSNGAYVIVLHEGGLSVYTNNSCSPAGPPPPETVHIVGEGGACYDSSQCESWGSSCESGRCTAGWGRRTTYCTADSECAVNGSGSVCDLQLNRCSQSDSEKFDAALIATAPEDPTALMLSMYIAPLLPLAAPAVTAMVDGSFLAPAVTTVSEFLAPITKIVAPVINTLNNPYVKTTVSGAQTLINQGLADEACANAQTADQQAACYQAKFLTGVSGLGLVTDVAGLGVPYLDDAGTTYQLVQLLKTTNTVVSTTVRAESVAQACANSTDNSCLNSAVLFAGSQIPGVKDYVSAYKKATFISNTAGDTYTAFANTPATQFSINFNNQNAFVFGSTNLFANYPQLSTNIPAYAAPAVPQQVVSTPALIDGSTSNVLLQNLLYPTTQIVPF